MGDLLQLLIVIASGLLVGQLSIRGITFGTSAILFVALAGGYWGVHPIEQLGSLGLAIFVFSIGISAGPTFFRGLAMRGRTMAMLGGMIVASGVLVAWAAAWILRLPPDLAGGMLAGAMTSTPALGAITQVAQDPSAVAVGFGLTYPVGIIAVVLTVQLLIKFSQHRPNEGTTIPPLEGGAGGDRPADSIDEVIERFVVEVRNPTLQNAMPSDVDGMDHFGFQISRVKVANRWRPLPADYRFQLQDRILVLGKRSEILRASAMLGTIVEDDHVVIDADRERKTLVVTSPEFVGRSLRQLQLQSRLGITIARIRRGDQEFVPSGKTVIEFGDLITVVGDYSALAGIEKTVGHRPRTLNESDLFSLAVGLAIGLVLGMVQFQIGGFSISLGIAGGPLIVGLVFGHFRRLGRLRGSFPPAAQLLLSEGGLALFLADAGVRAGREIGPVFAQHGASLCFAALLIAVVPMLVGYVAGKYLFRLDLPSNLGATCGGMTTTPGLAALTQHFESSTCVTSYVAAYPLSLVLMTILPPLFLKFLEFLQRQ